MIFPWQQKQWQQFLQAKSADRLAHALLVTGAKGLGKAQLLQAMAVELQGSDFNADDPHPDALWLRLEEKQSSIKIDQVRAAIEFSQQTLHSATNKVIVIEDAENLNTAAQNALLKLLEEPNPRCYLLLSCSVPGLLLATIRSRCQLLNLVCPAHDMALEWLGQQQPAIDVSTLKTALKLANHQPLLALTMLKDPQQLKLKQALLRFFQENTFGNLDISKTTKILSNIPLPEILYLFNEWVSDLIRVKASIKPVDGFISKDVLDTNQAVLDKLNLKTLLAFSDRLSQGLTELQSNVALNKQMLLDSLLIEWNSNVIKGV